MQSKLAARHLFLFALAIPALASCSEEPGAATMNTAVTPGAPCQITGSVWVLQDCNNQYGPCTTSDNTYTRTACQDPATERYIGPAATNTTGGVVTNTPPPPPPPATGTPTTTVGPGTVPTPTQPMGTGTVPVGPTTTAPVNTVPAPTTTDPNVTPTTTGTVPMTPPTDVPVDIPPPAGRTCPVTEGLIADFEEGSAATLAVEGRLGLWEGFNDEAGTRTDSVVDEGTDPCNKGVFHTTGSGYESYVGFGSTIASSGLVTNDAGREQYAPVVYDATAAGYIGISFRAKAGPGQSSAVRLSVATPWTEGPPYGDGTCVEEAGHITPCWNHLGHFLHDDEALTTEWKTFTFYFDRDMYPEWLPTGGSIAQRQAVGANILGIQFKFNQSFDPATGEGLPSKAGSFDFYLDDVRFVKTPPTPAIFASTDGASVPFGTSANLGSCALPPGAANYNAAISQAYARWKASFVQADGGVISPEQDNKISSEGISYGMLISAAFGDKATFDKIWGWASSRTSNGTALLGWDNGGGGSATDADLDIPFALLMAEKQWGGYASLASSMAALARSRDVESNGLLKGGENYAGVYNPSYFAPAYMRSFGADWASVISANYTKLESCDQSFSGLDGIVSDWCGGASGAQVTSEVCAAGQECSAYDAARVPYRIGYDVCVGGTEGSGFIQRAIATFVGSVEGGRIDLLKAGMDNTATATASAVNNEMAFLGTVGVGAMGAGNDAVRDGAFRATLDILERPEYYKTYYSTSLGLITMLMMTGNWPAP